MIDGTHVQALAKPYADGTFRARVFTNGRMTWECSHPHPTIEVAWDCARRQAESIQRATTQPEAV